MKKYFSLLVMALFMIIVPSCEEEIWDVGGIDVYIELVDENGSNLLDPGVEGNWVGENITVEYNDEYYPAIWELKDLQPQSRYYMPDFRGLVWSELLSYIKRPNSLVFGEFAGDNTYDKSIILRIEKLNTAYSFELNNKYKSIRNKPKIKTHITYNGKKIEGSTLKLVVPRNISTD